MPQDEIENIDNGLDKFHSAVDISTGNLKNTAASTEATDTPAGDKVDAAKASETETKTVNTAEPAKPIENVKDTTETVVSQVDWRQELKKADSNIVKEVLKEIGLDEFDADFINYRKSGGDPYKYLEVKGRDWSKIDDVEVLRRDLRSKFPDLDADSFDILAEKRINQRFGIGQDFTDPNEAKANAIEMKLEADALRKQFAEEDAKLIIPERSADTSQADAQAAAERQKQDFIDFASEHDATKSLVASKQIKLGEGSEVMNYEAEPDKILDYVLNPDKFFSLFHQQTTSPDGKKNVELNMNLMYKAINYALNDVKFEKALIDFGKSLGTKSEIEDLHNIPKEVKPVGTAERQMSLNERFMKEGREVPLV